MKKYIIAAIIVGVITAFILMPRKEEPQGVFFANAQEAPQYDRHSDSIEVEVVKEKTDSVIEEEKSLKTYKEISYPTPNYAEGRRNSVEGVILHHTAEPTIERSLGVLTSLKKKVGTHCVIDLDGTRYKMCKPEVVTYHAGYSVLNGKENCNNFTIGIEFQGNTLENPLTEDQINSAIEYLLPIMAKYNIPVSNVVSHEMVRKAYKRRYPNKRCSGKVDITPTEYNRFMKELKRAINDGKE